MAAQGMSRPERRRAGGRVMFEGILLVEDEENVVLVLGYAMYRRFSGAFAAVNASGLCCHGADRR